MPVPIAAGNHAGPIGASLARAGRATAGLDGVATFFTQLQAWRSQCRCTANWEARPRRLALHRADMSPPTKYLPSAM